MNLKDIIAIGGKPGLYKFIAQAKNGIIVESFADNKRFPAYSSDKVSALNDIAIFTEEGEMPLKEVFKKIFTKEDGGKCMDPKSNGDALKAYFAEIIPEYDKDKVYTSDMKKVLTWYNTLHELGMIDLQDDEEEKEESVQGEIPDEKAPENEAREPQKDGNEEARE